MDFSHSSRHLLWVSEYSLLHLDMACSAASITVAVAQDMLDCTLAVLSPTEVPEVQRAAVLLCSRMIKTLGNDGVVGNQKQMQRLYTHLKVCLTSCPKLFQRLTGCVLQIVVRNNTDELTRVHAMSALDDLGSIMMKFLFPKDNACQLHVSM